MNTNGKITEIFMNALGKFVEILFTGINIVCTKSATFVSNHTDILSVSELEKLFFVILIVVTIIASIKAIDNSIYYASKYVRNVQKTTTKLTIEGIKSKPLSSKHFFGTSVPTKIFSKQIANSHKPTAKK